MAPSRFSPATLLPLVAMAALAGITYWLLQATRPPADESVTTAKTHTPDYFAENFSVTELDETGATQYRLTAARLVHYEDDEVSDLVLPALRAFQPGKPVVTTTARRGTVNGDASVVDLYDDARILRAAGPQDPPMEADSSHFRVLVNDDVITSEKPVKLQRGLSLINASNGMKYNNVTRVIELYGNVRGTSAASDVSGGSSK
jgi:lipopolysaccharide export system protein LptC